jgi:hypothetical protein
MIAASGINDVIRMYNTTQRDGIGFNLAYIGSDSTEELPQPFDQGYMRAAHNDADRELVLPPGAAQLLVAMFPTNDTCQRNLDSLAREGFNPRNLLLLNRRGGCDDAPSREGIRPKPCRAAGPQRQTGPLAHDPFDPSVEPATLNDPG